VASGAVDVEEVDKVEGLDRIDEMEKVDEVDKVERAGEVDKVGKVDIVWVIVTRIIGSVKKAGDPAGGAEDEVDVMDEEASVSVSVSAESEVAVDASVVVAMSTSEILEISAKHNDSQCLCSRQ
jgi:hypothetical protein